MVARALAIPLTIPLALVCCVLVVSKQMPFDVGYAPWRRAQFLMALGLVVRWLLARLPGTPAHNGLTAFA